MSCKKGVGFLRPGYEVIQTLITHMREKAAIARLCPLLGLSPSGFYAARSRLSRPRIVSMQETQLQAALQTVPKPTEVAD